MSDHDEFCNKMIGVVCDCGRVAAIRADEREKALETLDVRIATHRHQPESTVYRMGFHAGFIAARETVAVAARRDGEQG